MVVRCVLSRKCVQCKNAHIENVSSVEVENVISKHPLVNLVAVVGQPDDKWGEVPCAFVEIMQRKRGHEKMEESTRKDDGESTVREDILEFCRGRLAGY